MEDIGFLSSVEDPVKRRALFSAMLSKEVSKRSKAPLVVVGGEAVEIYTQGSYSTGDIDIVSPLEPTEAALLEWGFEKTGRVWLNRELDMYVDWQGGSLDGGKEPETVRLTDELAVRVIAVEDLVLDRLNAAKWWGDTDSLMWAKVLVNIKRALGGLDEGYLRGKAKDVSDMLEEALR